MQIGNMGGDRGRARPPARGGRGPACPETQILLLLDREADKFLATRADVDGVLVKPVDAGRLRRAVKNLLKAAPDRCARAAEASAG